MTTDPFELLIQQLGSALNVPLHVDHNYACAIKVHNQLTIQLQIDAAQENVLIASLICEVPPGKFRENVLCEALKANHLPDPRTGILGFLLINNRLTLHQRYPFAILDGEKLAQYVAGFIDYAELWRAAIESGLWSPAPIRPSASASPFGMKR
ncbi:MAG: scc1-B [Parachlamydiales bacterium]|nr:scc1-B [Parachlamydiales bacterium]